MHSGLATLGHGVCGGPSGRKQVLALPLTDDSGTIRSLISAIKVPWRPGLGQVLEESVLCLGVMDFCGTGSERKSHWLFNHEET